MTRVNRSMIDGAYAAPGVVTGSGSGWLAAASSAREHHCDGQSCFHKRPAHSIPISFAGDDLTARANGLQGRARRNGVVTVLVAPTTRPVGALDRSRPRHAAGLPSRPSPRCWVMGDTHS